MFYKNKIIILAVLIIVLIIGNFLLYYLFVMKDQADKPMNNTNEIVNNNQPKQIDPKDLDPNEDYDNDGLTNGQELVLGLNALSADTDKDGWDDFYEYNNEGFDPFIPQPEIDFIDNANDTDNDGYLDILEEALGMDPLQANNYLLDSDADLVPDEVEFKFGTNHNLADTDGDGINDNQAIEAILLKKGFNFTFGD